MEALSRAFDHAEQLLVQQTRRSQAAVIASTDRLARDGDDQVRPLGRLWRANLALLERLVGDPLGAVDRAYDHTLRVVAMHREFAHRIFEAIDTRGLGETSGSSDDDGATGATVIWLARRRERHGGSSTH
ncbi:hypothetical protein [Nocardioides sp. GXZ039]|uniref:hypothetical protein n=1 Tax=Nocardioides sp. GXZ039 TaxID=3136018 RepID=UPI0030F42127